MTTSAAAALSGAPAPAAAPAPGAAPITDQTGAPVIAPAAQNDGWFSPIANQEVRSWAEAKGWKDPLAAVESAYNLEKLVGFEKAGRTLVMPKDDAPPEERRAFLTKLGVPEKADGYKLPVPDGQSPEFSKTAAAWFHEAGVPAKAAEAVAAKWNAYVGGAEKAEQDKRAQQSELDMTSLKAEWGQAHDQNMELARRATRQFIPGTTEQRQEVLTKIENAIGSGAMLKLFASIGTGLGEHKVHGNGEGSGLALTPAQATQRISELRSNKDWTTAYLGGDKEKLAEMERLQKIAAGVGN